MLFKIQRNVVATGFAAVIAVMSSNYAATAAYSCKVKIGSGSASVATFTKGAMRYRGLKVKAIVKGRTPMFKPPGGRNKGKYVRFGTTLRKCKKTEVVKAIRGF